MKPLLTKEEYKEAYEQLNELAFSKEIFTEEESNEIELLKAQIDDYQKKNIHIPNPTQQEAVKFKLSQENELHQIDFTFNEINDLCEIVSTKWLKDFKALNLKPENDHIKLLMDKLIQVRNGIVVSKLK